jgi:hypothetical protein
MVKSENTETGKLKKPSMLFPTFLNTKITKYTGWLSELDKFYILKYFSGLYCYF